MSLRGRCYSCQSSGCCPHEKSDYNGLSNVAERQQMLVKSCIEFGLLYLKQRAAELWHSVLSAGQGPSCHRGTVPKAELVLSPVPAVSGCVQGCWHIPSTAAWGSPLLLHTPLFHGRSGPCSIPPALLSCDRGFSPLCFSSSPSGRSHWFATRKSFFGDQIWTFSSQVLILWIPTCNSDCTWEILGWL